MSYYKVEVDIKGIRPSDYEYISSNEVELIGYINYHNIKNFNIETFEVSGYFIIDYVIDDYIKFIYYSSDDKFQTDRTIDSISKMVNRDKILNRILKDEI